MTPTLILSAADQENIHVSICEILTCGRHQTLSEWRLSVHRAVKRLLDADMAMSYIGTHPLDNIFSEETGRVKEFPQRAAPMIKRFDTFRRTEKLRAWSRSSLWGPHLDEFYRSAYYNEFSRPLGSIDGAGLAVVVGAVHAGIQLHRDSLLAGGLSERHVAILRMLLPAFEVGSAMALAHFGFPSGVNGQQRAFADERRSSREQVSEAGIGNLTPREFQVASLLASRRSNREIADVLQVSPATAKRHTENILLKLGLRSRREVERVLEAI